MWKDLYFARLIIKFWKTFWSRNNSSAYANVIHDMHETSRPIRTQDVIGYHGNKAEIGSLGEVPGNELVTMTTANIKLKKLSSPLLPLSSPLHSTPLHSTPLHSTPLHSTPLHSTPLHSTPLHSLSIDPSLAQPRIELGPPASEVVCLPLRYRTLDAGGNSNLYTSTCLYQKSRSGRTFKVAR